MFLGGRTPRYEWTSVLTYTSLSEISEYEDGRRRSLSAQEGSTAVIECPLPHSVPPALPRLRVRGEWIDASTGLFGGILPEK